MKRNQLGAIPRIVFAIRETRVIRGEFIIVNFVFEDCEMSACLRRMAFASILSLSAAPVLAHPGHGKDGGSHEMTHYLTEPEHLAPLAIASLVGVVAAGAVIWYRRRA